MEDTLSFEEVTLMSKVSFGCKAEFNATLSGIPYEITKADKEGQDRADLHTKLPKRIKKAKIGLTCSPNMNFCCGSNSPHICSSSWGFASLPLDLTSTTMVWYFFLMLYAITSAHLSWVFTASLSSILDWRGEGLCVTHSTVRAPGCLSPCGDVEISQQYTSCGRRNTSNSCTNTFP